jgi:competence protein ComEA
MNTYTHITRSTKTAALILSLLLGPVLGAHAESPSTEPASKAQAAPSATGVLNLNTATEDELIMLPGIGPSRAKAILELRTKLSGFKKVEDLMRVKGIGRKTYRKLEPLLRLDGKTTLVEATR